MSRISTAVDNIRYTYVGKTEPLEPLEGETWYRTDTDSAFVFDGANWVETTIVDHGQLSGLGSNDHHSRPSSTTSSSDRVADMRVITIPDDSSATERMYCLADKVEYSKGYGPGSYNVYDAAGNKVSSGSVDGSSTTDYFNTAFIKEVSVNGDGFGDTNQRLDLRPVTVASHSHNIR